VILPTYAYIGWANMNLGPSPLGQPTGHSGSGADASSDFSIEAVHFVLHRILSSKTFANAPRYRDFLQFTVTEALAGHGQSLKEYVIAVEVFNQSQSFDPRISPLVRVAASRLRTRLKVYYDSEGLQDPILIDYPKGGYVPVFRHRQQIAAKGPDNHRSFWFQPWRILTSVGLLVLMSLFGVSIAFFLNGRNHRRESPSRPEIQIYKGTASVAVLPFLNSGAARETENFSGWLAQELVNMSNNVGSLRAAPTDALASFEGASPDVRSLGARLGVDTVLQGSIRGSGGRLQVSVQLVAVKSGYHLWSDIYDCLPADTIVTQHVIARAVVNALQRKSAMMYQKPDAVSLATYNLYIDGLYQMRQGGDKRLLYARESFERAIAADPAFGLAYSGLAAARVRLIKWDIVPFNDGLAQAQAAAEKALELHEQLPEAHAVLAVVNSLHWQWQAASQDFAIAIRNDPSSAELREAYAIAYLLPMRRLDEALEGIRKAAALDPLSPSIGVSEAFVRYCQRDYEGAIDECRKALAMQSDLIGAHLGLASALAEQSRFTEAMASIESLKIPADDPMVVSFSGYLAGASGVSRDAKAALVRLDAISDRKPVPSYYKSLIYLGMGNTGQALRWLDQAYVEREPSLIYLAVNPRWDRLRSHPRFIALLRKIGLPQ
jgi:TolB-like protein/Flp pilus assembly protein TadD